MDDPHFWAGVLRPIFWLVVLLPFLVGLRWLLNRYLRPRLSGGAWEKTKAPIGDVVAAVVILLGIMVAGFLVT